MSGRQGGPPGALSGAARRTVRAVVPEALRARLNYYLVGEPALIKAELSRLSGPWSDFRGGRPSRRMTERVVEIPWALSRYQGERRVLDIGSPNAVPLYLRHLIGLHIPELVGLDLSSRPVRGMQMVVADVRKMPFADRSFDLIFCVSTLEHIGMDNSGYGVTGDDGEAGDIAALKEMRRVTADDGRLLVTVPFGKAVNYGWFHQYDLPGWTRLLEASGWRALETAFYGYGGQGWGPAPDPGALATAEYRQGDAPAATGLLCADLRPATSG